MTSKDIEQRIHMIETRIFGLKLKLNSHYITNNEYMETIHRRVELNEELKILKEKLKLNNLRKEKLDKLNNVLCH